MPALTKNVLPFLETIDIAAALAPTEPDLSTKLFMAVEQSPSIVIIADASGRIEYVNPKYSAISGYSREEVTGKQMRQTSTTYLSQDEITRVYEQLRNGHEWHGEFRNKKKDKSFYWVSSHISPLKNSEGLITHFIDVEEDITERKLSDERLRASLKEKEVMLMEIHHRVKNNLQVISSLLNLQSAYISNEKDMAVFRDCQNQVRSMALIHEKMYQSHDIAIIDFGNYIRSLTANLIRTYSMGYLIRTDINVEQVYLDANFAVPCGLILNELITNCIKYAFPDSTCGIITIELFEKNEQVTLIVRDDGIGMPRGMDLEQNTTMGIHLVHDLVRQIEGTVEVDNSKGTCFTIRFANL
jgi:hypothetical protein